MHYAIRFSLLFLLFTTNLNAGVMEKEYEDISEESRFCLELVGENVNCTLETKEYSYTGTFKHGFFHGKGDLSFKSGETLKGTWVEGVFFGDDFKVIELSNEPIIVEAIKPKPYVLQSTLNACEGEMTIWSNCFGVFNYFNGKYFGEWQRGHKHGKGLTINSSGKKLIQSYKYGKVTKETEKDFVELRFLNKVTQTGVLYDG